MNSWRNNERRNLIANPLPSYDADAQAFFDAAGITDATQMSAVDTLVTSLKSNNLWTKFHAIYPMVGGTATTHKYNLKDPRDLDAAFRLTFAGGWTHSSTGALPNGSTGYANTHYIESSHAVTNSGHISYYSRTDSNGTYCEIGGLGAGSIYTDLLLRYSGNAYYLYRRVSSPLPSTARASSKIMGTLVTNGSNIINYTNDTSIGTQVLAQSGLVNVAYYLAAENPTGVYSNRECAFATIGLYLTADEVSSLYTIVQTYQTTLSRQV